MAIFENPDWGWKEIPHTDVDIAAWKMPRFSSRNVKTVASRTISPTSRANAWRCTSGYHYEFANFNADPKYLADTFNATLTYSHDSNLLMVLRARRHRSGHALCLFDYLLRNEKVRDRCWCLYIDQVYHHYAILRPTAPITGEAFGKLLRVCATMARC